MTWKEWWKPTILVAVAGIGVQLMAQGNRQVVNGVNNENSTIGQQYNYFPSTKDPSFENARDPALGMLSGQQLIERWFQLMNNGQYQEGCSLHSKDKCDASNGEDVLVHAHEVKTRLVDGYHLDKVWHAENAPTGIWCVKYHYDDRQFSGGTIALIMQYKLVPRSDGAEDISSRECEKMWKADIGEQQCKSFVTPHYCDR